MVLNETHDPLLHSWLSCANVPDTDFPIQNLPFGIFRRAGSTEGFRGGIAIGDQILDLAAALKTGDFGASVIGSTAARAAVMAAGTTLNEFMAAGPATWSSLRLMISRALRENAPQQQTLQRCLVAQAEAEFSLPAHIGDYTDFYTSIHHAITVGRLFRPDNPLLPNYKWLPIGYHGRCSSIAISGQHFPRPSGQKMAAGAQTPNLGPSERLDYELELGAFVGPGNALGSSIPINDAESHLFGLCLLNDWSARDLQAFEYQPLGPFLGKNFATTISPWIVTMEALEPYRIPWTRPVEDPQPMDYLDSIHLRSAGAVDVKLEVYLETRAMRGKSAKPHRLSHSNFKHAYWNLAQMITHHTVNGCNLRPGDLLGTGTQSGPECTEAGSLLELSCGGKQAIVLSNGESRVFLADGDSIIMRGWCERAGFARLGFGEVTGCVSPARRQNT